jgi:radical SAM superfamily enzyme YgiQ (UPF0313 family)
LTADTGIKVLLLHSRFVGSNRADPALRIAPLGLQYISGFLESKGYETKILAIEASMFQARGGDLEREQGHISKELLEFQADYIGYSFRNLYGHERPASRQVELIDFFYVSREKPVIDFLRTLGNTRIVGGGSAFSLAPRLYMRYLGLDYGIVGEGEVAFETLLSTLARGEDPSALPGLVYRENGKIRINAPQPISDLNIIPVIDPEKIRQYGSFYYHNGGYGSVQTKRGCRFRCSYCVYPYLEGSAYRLRSPETTAAEILSMKKKHGIRHFFIVDSVFSFPTEHSVAFCDELTRSGVDIGWEAYINPRGITKSVLRRYKRSGCQNLVLTPDTFSPRMLDRYRKDFSLQEIERCIELLHESGIPFEVALIIGGPGEDEASVNETISFCDRHLQEVPVMVTMGLWLHPFTQAWDSARQEGHFSPGEVLPFEEVVLGNNFPEHARLHYFFPHAGAPESRRDYLIGMLALLRRYKRIVVGLDSLFEKKTELYRYDRALKVKPYARPWHRGMQGRSSLSE